MPELSLVTFNAHAGIRPRKFSVPRPWTWSTTVGGPALGPYDLASVVAGFDADVIVVQEAYRPDAGPAALDEAAAKLGYDVHEVPFGRVALEPWPHISATNGSGQIGVAVLTRFPVRQRFDLPIPPAASDPAPHRQALHLQLDVDGALVDVVGVHLTSRQPHGASVQLRRLRPQLPCTIRPAVVAGDFNLWGPPVSSLLEGWRRAVRGRTWPAHRPHSQIDHVLTRDGVEVLEAEVMADAGSDHRPVRARLRFPS